jgi:hypothetical protein
VIFHQPDAPADFAGVERALLDAFHASREAARNGEPIVYVLSQPDLLGQRGALGAILANALLSAMRTLAAEGHRANAIAVGDDPTHVEQWIGLLEQDAGVTGELVRLGPAHVGKALT